MYEEDAELTDGSVDLGMRSPSSLIRSLMLNLLLLSTETHQEHYVRVGVPSLVPFKLSNWENVATKPQQMAGLRKRGVLKSKIEKQKYTVLTEVVVVFLLSFFDQSFGLHIYNNNNNILLAKTFLTPHRFVGSLRIMRTFL